MKKIASAALILAGLFSLTNAVLGFIKLISAPSGANIIGGADAPTLMLLLKTGGVPLIAFFAVGVLLIGLGIFLIKRANRS